MMLDSDNSAPFDGDAKMIFKGMSTVDLMEVISIHILIHQVAHTGACSAQFGACGAQQSAWPQPNADTKRAHSWKDFFMKRIVVRFTGMPFDPTYEIDDDTIAIGDRVRVPGSEASFIQEGEIGTVIALVSPYTGPCKHAVRA